MANPAGATKGRPRHAGAGKCHTQNRHEHLMVTHKTNIAEHSERASDAQEGEAFVYRSSGSAPAAFVARVKPAFWIGAGRN